MGFQTSGFTGSQISQIWPGPTQARFEISGNLEIQKFGIPLTKIHKKCQNIFIQFDLWVHPWSQYHKISNIRIYLITWMVANKVGGSPNTHRDQIHRIALAAIFPNLGSAHSLDTQDLQSMQVLVEQGEFAKAVSIPRSIPRDRWARAFWWYKGFW